MSKKKYDITQKECEESISGVCGGCGGELEAIETVNNGGKPTFWTGCKRCGCYRGGVKRKHYEVARILVERGELIPYSHLRKQEYQKTEKDKQYWLQTQTAGAARTIRLIMELLEEKEEL